jgi:hypothetical protein
VTFIKGPPYNPSVKVIGLRNGTSTALFVIDDTIRTQMDGINHHKFEKILGRSCVSRGDYVSKTLRAKLTTLPWFSRIEATPI